ncbi:hypothetical protein [Ruegeria atlantica]|nr:hypothetical protein [Ruegeria atlantica]
MTEFNDRFWEISLQRRKWFTEFVDARARSSLHRHQAAPSAEQTFAAIE